MKHSHKAILESHLATFLFAMVAVVIKFTTSSLIVIAAGRSAFAFLSLLLYIYFIKGSIKLKSKEHYVFLILLGVIQTFQWLTIFKAIKVTDVTTALIALYTFPLFITFLEPMVYKEKIKLESIISAIAILVGVYLILPEFSLANNQTVGVIYGVISAILVSVMLVMHRFYIKKYSSETITFYKTATASVILLPVILFLDLPLPIESDVYFIPLLGVFLTALPYVLFINSFKKINAQQASVVLSMEVVYGIILAIMFFNEIPNLKTLIGGLIIIYVSFRISKK